MYNCQEHTHNKIKYSSCELFITLFGYLGEKFRPPLELLREQIFKNPV